MAKSHVQTQSKQNIWMYLFWTLLLLVITMFALLSYFGVVHINTGDNRIFVAQKYRRSASSPTYSDQNSGDSKDESELYMKRGEQVVIKDSDHDEETVENENVVIEKDPSNKEDEAEQRDKKVKKKQNTLTETELLEFHMKAVNKINAPNIEKNLVYLSSKSHLGGTDESSEMATWIADKFRKSKFDTVETKTYKVLVSYPREPGRLRLFDKKGKETENIVVLEKKLDEFEKTTNYSIYPPYLAYSKSATTEGELIYANYGRPVDFRLLDTLNVSCNKKIVLMRYGQFPRNRKIRNAQDCGAKGVILFSDPETYAPTGVSYPDSWYLPPDGVMRGTLAQTRGDILSKGFPSIKGLYQRPLKDVHSYPKIPVQPIGYGDAEKLLKTLDGESPNDSDWNGGINITYKVNSKDSRKVKISVNVTKEIRPIDNVIGIIEGAFEPDRIVLVGNHRDAWGYGAADPSSGTAVMVEIARVLGELKKEGWKPRRTIIISSWDAEEFGLLGSTEWSEEYAKLLGSQAVAYLNVDTAVQGNYTMELKSSPELIDVFFDAARRFKDPSEDINLYDSWLAKHKKHKYKAAKYEPDVGLFGEGSDYMPFYGDLGIPSMDIRYNFNTIEQGVANIPVYHTMHDNINWMRKFLDPDFRYHSIVAQVFTRVILLLADSTLLPFNFIRYSNRLLARVKDIDDMVKKHKLHDDIDIGLLKNLTKNLREVTERFHKNVQELDKEDQLTVRQVNDQMLNFERTYITSESLTGENKNRNVYHTAGLLDPLRTMGRAKKNDNEEDYNKAMLDFKQKYSVFTHHVLMSVYALENPFTKQRRKSTKERNKEDEDEDE